MVDISMFKEKLENSIINVDIIKIFDTLLTISVEEWASDIHIEPFETYCRVRIRVDGVLEELTQYPTTIHDSLIAKFKIESWQMRPDEKRLPQDARVFHGNIDGKRNRSSCEYTTNSTRRKISNAYCR